LSPAQLVQVVAPNGLEKLTAGDVVTVAWRSSGIPAGGTVTIELVQDGNPAPVLTVAPATPNDGQFAWTVPNLPGGGYRVRVTANEASLPRDASDDTFLIAPAGHDFYVNDASTAGDVFTTAPGDNAESGK